MSTEILNNFIIDFGQKLNDILQCVIFKGNKVTKNMSIKRFLPTCDICEWHVFANDR